MDFYKGVHAQLSDQSVKVDLLLVVKFRDDQKDGVRSNEAGVADISNVDREVFSQDRQICFAACCFKVIYRASEILIVCED